MSIEKQTAIEQIEEILQGAEDVGIRTLERNGAIYYIVSDIEDKFPEAFNEISVNEAYEVANLVRKSNKSVTFEAWVISDDALEDLYSDLYEEKSREESNNDIAFANNEQEAEDINNAVSAQHGGITDIIVVDKSLKEESEPDLTLKNIIKEYVKHYVYEIAGETIDSADLATRYQEGYRILFTSALTAQGSDSSRELLQEFFALPEDVCKLDWLIENGFGPSVLEAARRLFPISNKPDFDNATEDDIWNS